LEATLAGYTPRALGARGGELVETVGAGSLCNYSLLRPTAVHAAAEKRIALLIGNKDYRPQ
jgi:hypothetical protein